MSDLVINADALAEALDCEKWRAPRIEAAMGAQELPALDALRAAQAAGVADSDILRAARYALPTNLRIRWISGIVDRVVRTHALYCGIDTVEVWARGWLDGTDRSIKSARAARLVAQSAEDRVAACAAAAAEAAAFTVTAEAPWAADEAAEAAEQAAAAEEESARQIADLVQILEEAEE